ncbi:autotransporter domain-containing protein [Edaphovirga cremea]|uniref:autotransporter domain-containing protein n=1 Tax=Edaphovirga cremea TaxID=2267246 RepID=UPI003989DA6D
MTDLGTLRADNTGTSSANAVSADGRVVVGQADSDSGYGYRAFRHNEGDSQMTALGTLRADNSGWSSAYAVSADGRVVVGAADNDSGDGNFHAFRHNEGDSQMTDLGTLRADNSGRSASTAVSADGRVVVGEADNDAGNLRAVVWKVTTPELPEPPTEPVPPTPPIIIIVDKDNTHQAMANTAGNAQQVLSLYQGALDSLADARCQIGQRNYCVGAFTQLNTAQSSNYRMATGLFGSVRLPDEHWTVGASFNLAHNTELVDGYDTRGDHKPGLGLFTRYQTNRDNSGLSIDASGVFIQQDMTIQRDVLANTEAGKGDATIKGYQARLTATYGIPLNDRTQIAPLVAIKYQDIYRTGYTENSHAAFPASYGRMGSKNTSLQLGMDASHDITSQLRVSGGVGADVNLDRRRDAFTGQIDYIGAYHYDTGETQDVKPYAYVGVNVDITTNSTVRVSSGWQQTDYSKDVVMVGLSYSYHW